MGNVMDLNQAHYMKSHSANWQHGFGIVYADGHKTTALAVPIIKGQIADIK